MREQGSHSKETGLGRHGAFTYGVVAFLVVLLSVMGVLATALWVRPPSAKANLGTSLTDTTTEKRKETKGSESSASTSEFTVEFSYRGTVYTMPGCGSVSLDDLLGKLGCDIPKSDSIGSVTSSDPSLVAVDKVDDGHGQREWQVRSIKPFDTDENLLISLDSGDTIRISVADSNGYDLYSVNGSYITLLGNGEYVTANGSSTTGSTSYEFNLGSSLTSLTTLNVGTSGATGTAVVSFDGTVLSTNLVIAVADGWTLTLTVDNNQVRNIVLEEDSTITLAPATSGATLQLASIDGTESNGSSVTLAVGMGIVVSGDVKAGELTMEPGASVTGTAYDGTATPVAGSRVMVGELSVDSSTISAPSDTQIRLVRATSAMTLTNATIRAHEVGLGGGGTGTLSADGGTLDADTIGALDDDTQVERDTFTANTNTDTIQFWDYGITYHNYASNGSFEVFSPTSSSGAPVSYRVRVAGANRRIVGYTDASGTFSSGEAVPLGSGYGATRQHWEFRSWSSDFTVVSASDRTNAGWMAYDSKTYDGSGHAIVTDPSGAVGYGMAEIVASSGAVDLYATYVPESLVMEFHTNLNSGDSVYAYLPIYVGAQAIDLEDYLSEQSYPVLSVAGYTPRTLAMDSAGSNQVAVASFSIADSSTTDLYVLWIPAVISVTPQLLRTYEGHEIQISMDGSSWTTLTGSTLEDLNASLISAFGLHTIAMGETYPQLPSIRIVLEAGGTEEYVLVGWHTATLSSGSTMTIEGGVTRLTPDTITASELSSSVQVLYANIIHKPYPLTVTESHAKWTFYSESGEELAFVSNGDGTATAQVESDSVVRMVRSDETTVDSYWKLAYGANTIIPTEATTATVASSPWLEYSFTMPHATVTGTLDATAYLDTAEGDYVFGTYSINGHSSYGYQIQDPATGTALITRRWIISNNVTTAYFTSSAPTSNRIVVDAATNLHFKDVQLTARGDVVNRLSSFYSNGVWSGNSASPIVSPQYRDYANILALSDGSQSYSSSTSYTVNIYLDSDSSVYCMGQTHWGNDTMSYANQAHSITCNVRTGGHRLSFYATIFKGTSTFDGGGTIEALTTGNSDTDSEIHWIHMDASGLYLSGVTANASQRDIYCRLGGSLTSSGNGTALHATNSTLNDVGTLHGPHIYLTNDTITASRILTIGYAFHLNNTRLTADILGYNGNVYTGYGNADNEIVNGSVVNVAQWISSARLVIAGNSKVTAQGGLCLYQALNIYGSGTEVTVGSIQRFRTVSGSGGNNGYVYNGGDSRHQFRMNIYSGAKVTVTGQDPELRPGENAVNIGVVHEVINPSVSIYGSGTSVLVTGDADIINNLVVRDGARLSVNGNLTVHQDLTVSGRGTTLEVTSNLWHVNTATTYPPYRGTGAHASVDPAYRTGTTPPAYWVMTLNPESSVTVGGSVLGSKGATDYTNVVYMRNNTNTSVPSSVVRDVQVFYAVPDGFENVATNPTNVRLVNDVTNASVTLAAPSKTDSNNPLTLGAGDWVDDDTSEGIAGWGTSNLAEASSRSFSSPIQIMHLTATPSSYLMSLSQDDGAVTGVEISTDGGFTWVPQTVSEQMLIPVDAEVRIAVTGGYEGMCFAESLTSGVYSPVPMTEDGVRTYRFTMSEIQIHVNVKLEYELYLDLHNIYVQRVNGMNGFSRYDGTQFVPYDGNLLITQKDSSATSDYTLYIQRDVDATQHKVSVTGIRTTSTTACNTIELSNVTATLNFLGTNWFRNIVNPISADLTLLSATGSSVRFVNTGYYYPATGSAAQYCSKIGSRTSLTGGRLTIIGGTYYADASPNGEGTVTFISASHDVLVQDAIISSSIPNHGHTIHTTSSSTITIKGSTIDVNVTPIPYVCRDLVVDDSDNRSSILTSKANGSNRAYMFNSVTHEVTLKGHSSVVESGTPYALGTTQTITIQDEASYHTPVNLILLRLNVKDDAELVATENAVANATYGKMIAARTIDVTGGTVICGQLLCAGYSESLTTGPTLLNRHQSNSGLYRNGTIGISGGTVDIIGSRPYVITPNDTAGVVTPILGTIGGVGTPTVSISGGDVSADLIGEGAYEFGCHYYTNYAIAREDNQGDSTVHLTGGTISEFDTIGGTSSTVLIEGATLVMPDDSHIMGESIEIGGNADIAMGDDATIGNPDSDISIGGSAYVHGDGNELGRIEAEGGTLEIGDSSSVHVGSIDLTGGSIEITTTSTRLSSDYDYDHSVGFVPYNVGVLVDCGEGNDDTPPSGVAGDTDGDLIAMSVTIATRTHVGAKRIGSNASSQEPGSLTMESGCHVYTYQYGKFGEGEIEVDIDPGAVINGNRQIAINYDTPADTIMPADTVYSYVSDIMSSETIDLPVPYRYGYHFEGWKLSDNLQGSYWTEVPYSRMADISLKAIWTPVKIWVRIDKGADQSPRYQWQSISYGDESVVFDAVTKPNYFGNALVPDSPWMGTNLFPASVIIGDSYEVPSDLYTTYLTANGVTSSGATSVSPDDAPQRAMLESLTNKDLAGAASTLVPVTMTTQWQLSIHNIVFDAADTAVSLFMFNGVPRTIDRVGTGRQTLTFFISEPYSLSTLAPTYTGVPAPVRAGYDFLYWQDGEFLLRTNGTGSEDGGTTWSSGAVTVDGEHSTLTAQYAPRTYTVYLDVSHDGVAGTFSSYSGMGTETSGTYAGMPCFTTTFGSSLFPTGLPDAMIRGYITNGWSLYRVDDGTETLLGTATGDTVVTWDVDCFVLRPVASHTTVTYDLHGGHWADEEMLPTYASYVSESLPTVTYTTDGGTSIETDFSRPTSGAGHMSYAVYDGTGGHNDLYRRGCRFIGWTEDSSYSAWQSSGQDAVTWFSDPTHATNLLTNANVMYENKTYHAVWHENHYDVTLKAWHTSDEVLTWENASIGGTVDVRYDGATSTTAHEGDTIVLPERSNNRVLSHTKTSNGVTTVRQLLGWMFSSENPVTSYYDSDGSIKVTYATTVMEQMNAGGVFQNGDTFLFPEDESIVADPGDGGSLTLYAIYRERSLIFIDQRPTGDVITKIADFDVTRSGYVQVPAVPVAPAGYELAGWYVNKTTPEAARRYDYYGMEYAHTARSGVNGTVPSAMPLNPNSDLFDGIDNGIYVRHSDGTTGTYMQEWYVAEAESVTETYDVYAYSYYAPHVVLTLDGLSQAGLFQSPYDTVTVPEQLAVDQANDQTNITYTVDTSQLSPDVAIVGSVSGITNDNQIAVKLSIMQGEGGSETGAVWLAGTGGTPQSSTAYITSGKELHVEVYNNGGISETKPLGRLIVTVQFPKLSNAQLILNIDLSQETASYELDMLSDIVGAWNVTNEAYSSISGWTVADGLRSDGYDATQPVRYKTFTYGASSEGVLPILSLEGYTFTGWADESSVLVVSRNQEAGYEYGDLSYKTDVAPYLAQAFTARWSRNVRQLSLDAGMLENWSVSFSDCDGSSLTLIPIGGAYNVPYGATVTLTPKLGHEANGYPEFVNGCSLTGTGPYEFTMPDEDVHLTFNRVKTLDVSDGDIAIGTETYTQDGTTTTWRGDYILTGDSRTSDIGIDTGNHPSNTIVHAITLQDLSAGDVTVGSTVGSLSLSVSGTTTLTTIDCPSTEITLTGSDEEPSLTLVPVSSDGITGGSGVTIDGLACSVHVTNNDQTGGSNSVSAVSISGTLTLRDGARLDATTASSGITYSGTLIEASSVVIDDSTLTAQHDTSHPVSMTARLVAGSTDITLSGDAEVTSQLSIDTSGNLSLGDDASMTMVGNRANINATSITVDDTASIEAVNATISGNQSIALNADVIDLRGRHLDVKVGDISITDSGYHQDGSLLAERTVNEETPYVLVGGTNASCDVSIDSPYEMAYLDGVSIGDVSCQGEVGVTVLRDSTTGSISGDSADLTINGANHTLTASGDVTAHELTLRNVTVSAAGHGVGSTGDLLDGKVGTVTLDGVAVTASGIGALGALDDSFTLVTETGTNSYEGTLRKDLYRLTYDLGGGSFDNSANPSVLRSEVTYDSSHTASAVTYLGMKDVNGNGILSVGIPQDPVATGSVAFEDWYILGTDGKPVALRNSGGIPAWESRIGGTSITTLSSDTTSSERVPTEPDDGTETLTVRLRLLSGELTIRNLSEGVISNIGDVFEYSLTLPEGSYGYTKSLMAGVTLPSLDGDATGTFVVPAGGGDVTFTLLRGHQIVIRGVPLDVDIALESDHGLYSTTLTNDTPEYISGSGFGDGNVITSTSNETLTTTIRLSANGVLTFDNHSPDVAPTGLRFTYAPYLIVLGYSVWLLSLLGTASFLAMRHKPRTEAGDAI